MIEMAMVGVSEEQTTKGFATAVSEVNSPENANINTLQPWAAGCGN